MVKSVNKKEIMSMHNQPIKRKIEGKVYNYKVKQIAFAKAKGYPPWPTIITDIK